jgi:hypothetical protein
MFKKLLSLAALALMSLSAYANVSLMSGFGAGATDESGWTYDSESQTITFGAGAWKCCGKWLGGVDYSAYSSIVVEFAEPIADAAQLIVEYADKTNSSGWANAEATSVEAVLNESAVSVNQFYIQNSVAGQVIKIKDIYLVDPIPAGTEVVLFEGEQAGDWYPGLEIPKTSIISAGANATLTINVTINEGKDGWSYKLSTGGTSVVLPSFTLVSGYSEQWNTVWTSAPEVKYVVTADDIAVLQENSDSNFHITAGDAVINKVTITYAAEEGGESSSVNAIAVDNNAPIEYFNLQGVRVANPQNGLFIRRQGNVATKVLVK